MNSQIIDGDHIKIKHGLSNNENMHTCIKTGFAIKVF